MLIMNSIRNIFYILLFMLYKFIKPRAASLNARVSDFGRLTKAVLKFLFQAEFKFSLKEPMVVASKQSGLGCCTHAM